MENYIALEMIGEGAFGKVYKGQRKCTNQIVAIKKIVKKGKQEKANAKGKPDSPASLFKTRRREPKRFGN